MPIQVLVKVRGTKKHRAMIHAYDAETGHAVCYEWPAPGDFSEWEVQTRDVESFSQIPLRERCLRCEKKLNPKPPAEKKKRLSKRELREQAELEKWEKWTGKPLEGV